jgi:hypothetical protein
LNRKKISLSKKWLVVIGVLLGLLIADYGFKVYELVKLQNFGSRYVEIWTQWNVSYENDYLQVAPLNASQPFDSNDFDRFVQRSGEASVDMYLLKTEAERSFVLPWHNKVQYAYEDAINYIEEYHEYLEFINWEYTDNRWPIMNFKTDSRISELSAVASSSGEAAMPRLRLLEHLYTLKQ